MAFNSLNKLNTFKCTLNCLKRVKYTLNRLIRCKTAYSVGYSWIFGLVSIFAIGVIFIVFDQVFLAHIVPVIKNQVNNSAIVVEPATVTEIFANIDKYMVFWHALPFILFILIIVYMIIAAIRREGEEG